MGISNEYHFNWINDTIEPLKAEILTSLPDQPVVLGLSEQQANPFVQNLLSERGFQYQAIDRYAQTDDVLPIDLNDLSPLASLELADMACCFRASYFIEDKKAFLQQVSKVLKPGAYLCMDFLIGTSDLPTLGFYYGGDKITANYDPNNPSRFLTSFYDDRILENHPSEVAAFCKHARHWPWRTQWEYFQAFSKLFWRDRKRHAQLYPENLKQAMIVAFPEAQLFTLEDFEQHGFELVAFSSRYFYPLVRKFNLYSFVGFRKQS
ncbi:MAG: hypothetical protein DWQ07_09370 [Chloroflexi bacterium]|nr:MAG: hypothetical protein DWQ07_09370 [Chloroflexota bacterium]MBL1193077.1 hypothetical protein [Chloroflexota bacterium]NOH10370.1 hypothetical protein [Chloroflexota bacterium]